MNTRDADLVIIGGGGAGITAAVEALEQGLKKVIVVEKRSSSGGNAMFANGIFACDTKVQRLNMVDMPADEVYTKGLAWHHFSQVNPRILRNYINKTADTVHWLMDKGVEFEIGTEHRMTFNQEPSWHIAKAPEGKEEKGKGELARFGHVMKLLTTLFQEQGGEILYKTDCKQILKNEEGRISGVLLTQGEQEFQVNAPCVLLTTGGFIGNKDLLKKYFKMYDETFGGFFVPMMGDGIELAGNAGAALEDYATLVRENCFSSDKMKDTYLTVAAREPNIMWVNKHGRRFVAETAGFQLQPSVNVLYTQPGKVAYALYDESMIEEVMRDGWKLPRAPSIKIETGLKEKLRDSAASGEWVKIADKISDLAEWIGCSAEQLEQSVTEYNQFCEHGYDKDFVKERRFLVPYGPGPYYLVKFRTLIIETAGPVRVDEKMQVLDDDYQPIPGFYAAGSVTAGWLSNDYCGEFLFGSALSYAMCSGRIAVENAAKFA